MWLPLLWGCFGLVIWSCLPQAQLSSHETQQPPWGQNSSHMGSDNLCKLRPKLRYIFLELDTASWRISWRPLQVLQSVHHPCHIQVVELQDNAIWGKAAAWVSHPQHLSQGPTAREVLSRSATRPLLLSYRRYWGNWWLFPLKLLPQQGGILIGILFRLPLAASEQHSEEGAITLPLSHGDY